jgi:putative ABC transport system permease protein
MFKALLGDFKKSPVKMILTLMTVALGTGLLMLALSISDYLETAVTEKMEKGGLVLSYFNGTFDGDSLTRQTPPKTDVELIDHLEQEMDGFITGAPVSKASWNSVKANGNNWQIREVIATTPEYQEIMSLDMAAGFFFTQEMNSRGDKVAVISESTAELLFGSAVEAVGQVITPPEQRFGRPGSDNEVRAITNFEVVGVFKDVDELFRRSYDTGDIIIPIASIMPQGRDSTRMLGFMYSSGVFKVEGMSKDKAAATANMILTMAYGDDREFYFWEGDLEGNSSTLDEIRSTLGTFTIVISLLGFILLITSSIGILSIMMVEALGKSREIAIKRALGASRLIILREYFIKSLTLSALCSLVGLLVALLFITPFAQLVTPLIEGLSLDGLTVPHITLNALTVALFTALLAGGVLGTLPLFTIMKGVLADTIREG